MTLNAIIADIESSAGFICGISLLQAAGGLEEKRYNILVFLRGRAVFTVTGQLMTCFLNHSLLYNLFYILFPANLKKKKAPQITIEE